MEATKHKMLETSRLTELPINDIDLEETILYCLLHSKEARNDISKISEDDFWNIGNKDLFVKLKDFIQSNKEFDIHILPMDIKCNKTLLGLYGKNVLTSLWENYVKQLKDISARRKLQNLAYDLTVRVKEYRELAQIRSYLIEEIEKIDISGLKRMSLQNSEIEEEFMELLEKKDYGCIKAGFNDLDREIGGLYPGSFYVIGGIPAVGKSTFTLNILNNICKQGKKVLFVSLEMPYVEVQTKLVSELTGISTKIIRSGVSDTNLLQRIFNASSKIAEYRLYRMGNEGSTVVDIENEIKNLENVDVVFIDYLQKIKPLDSKRSRYEQVTQISRDLKIIATKFNIPVVSVASINRSFVDRNDKKPRLSDFRDSGNVEYDIDVALLLYRRAQFEDSPYSGDDLTEEQKKANLKFNQISEVIIAKNRYGKSNISIDMQWQPEQSRFVQPVKEVSYDRNRRKDIY